MLDECGAVQALPRESAGDLARIAGVTPRTAAVITAAVCNRHAAYDPAVATILTTAHRPESCRLTGRHDLPHEALTLGTAIPVPIPALEPRASTRITVACSLGRISTAPPQPTRA